MKKNIRKTLFIMICLTTLLASMLTTSCSFFENDVNDFMEKYTETAGVLQHKISLTPYKDIYQQDCINSKKSFTANFYMRNPKQFELITSVNFPGLDPEISREGVTIRQLAFDELEMVVPYEFLMRADEGRNISPEIVLYEPMSGRTFETYTFPLICNTVPPQLLNPTIINDGGQKFVLAFDMPSEEELSIRHKDLSTITINSVAYPVTIYTDGSFSFEDPRFSTEPKSSYIFLSGKTFKHSNRSVYFDTQDPFTEGDKEYELILTDLGGLTSSSFASTIITRLLPPSVIDFENLELEDGCNDIVPGNTEDPYKFTIRPATGDHRGNTVEGTTAHYALYKGTSTVSELEEEGTLEEAKDFFLQEGTYYLEVFSTKTNYEQSETTMFNLRVVDNAIYVSENGNDATADGTKDLQFATIAAAIKDLEARQLNNSDFNIYITGTLHENIHITTGAARSITLTKRVTADKAVIDAGGSGSVINLDTAMPLTLKNITITGGSGTNGGAVTMAVGSTLRLVTGAVLTGNRASGDGGAVYAPGGTNVVIADGATVKGNIAGGNGGGIYTDGSIVISGAINITGNSAGTILAPSNLCLGTNTVIDIDGALVNGSNSSTIGISTMKVPTRLTPVTITRHYGYNGGYNKSIIPGTYFIGDSHGIIYNETTGEAQIAINDGDFDDAITAQRIDFTLSRNWFDAGSSDAARRTITVTPVIKVQDVDITSEALADTDHPVTWKVQLFIGGQLLEGATFNTLEFTIPQSITYKDIYTLHVQALYNGVTYDDEFTVYGYEPE